MIFIKTLKEVFIITTHFTDDRTGTGSPRHLPAVTQLVMAKPGWETTSLAPQSELLAFQVPRWAHPCRERSAPTCPER